MNKLLALFLTAVLLVSCESDTVFSEVKAMEGHWGAEEVVEFKIPQLDSLKKYNLFCSIC